MKRKYTVKENYIRSIVKESLRDMFMRKKTQGNVPQQNTVVPQQQQQQPEDNVYLVLKLGKGQQSHSDSNVYIDYGLVPRSVACGYQSDCLYDRSGYAYRFKDEAKYKQFLQKLQDNGIKVRKGKSNTNGIDRYGGDLDDAINEAIKKSIKKVLKEHKIFKTDGDEDYRKRL